MVYEFTERAIDEIAGKLEDYVVDASDLDAGFIASLIKAYAVKPYRRDVLVDVVVHHGRESIRGCTCGWSKLGQSWAEHVADVYESAAVSS